MKIWIISFTEAGMRIGSRLAEALKSYGDEARVWIKKASGDEWRDNNEPGPDNAAYLSDSLSDWTCKAFSEAAAIVFIGASGIAVRAIAPYIKDKYQDPAVIVIDCLGKYCIPLLSGHLGGANRLSRKLAVIIGAIPVITTATDEEGLFAVDVFAADNSLSCTQKELCKTISSMVLSGQKVGFASDYHFEGVLPDALEEYCVADNSCRPKHAKHTDNGPYENITIPGLGIYITKNTDRNLFNKTLFLVPRSVWLGIGCRRGVSKERIRRAVDDFISKSRISILSVAGIATCDLKKDEEGLLTFANEDGLNLIFFTVGELAKQKGPFTSSEFVLQTIGVDNVCERAAVAAAGNEGALIISKKIYAGVTIAAAEALPKIKF